MELVGKMKINLSTSVSSESNKDYENTNPGKIYICNLLGELKILFNRIKRLEPSTSSHDTLQLPKSNTEYNRSLEGSKLGEALS
jgi:hypothetical protein